ncbi:MAG: hypothetical protein ACYTKD_14495 [Planctomycetota bacterium]|jgi:hypothetical protein
MIALAAHEEEGPRNGHAERPAGSASSGPGDQITGEPGCDCGGGRCEPGSACGIRPPWAFLEELRLDLLSACADPSDREALQAH